MPGAALGSRKLDRDASTVGRDPDHAGAPGTRLGEHLERELLVIRPMAACHEHELQAHNGHNHHAPPHDPDPRPHLVNIAARRRPADLILASPGTASTAKPHGSARPERSSRSSALLRLLHPSKRERGGLAARRDRATTGDRRRSVAPSLRAARYSTGPSHDQCGRVRSSGTNSGRS
jgi:hypothetical protein